MPVFWWMRLVLVFPAGRTTSGSVFWVVCELFIILGRLSANLWGCIPILIVVWHEMFSPGTC